MKSSSWAPTSAMISAILCRLNSLQSGSIQLWVSSGQGALTFLWRKMCWVLGSSDWLLILTPFLTPYSKVSAMLALPGSDRFFLNNEQISSKYNIFRLVITCRLLWTILCLKKIDALPLSWKKVQYQQWTVGGRDVRHIFVYGCSFFPCPWRWNPPSHTMHTMHTYNDIEAEPWAMGWDRWHQWPSELQWYGCIYGTGFLCIFGHKMGPETPREVENRPPHTGIQSWT